MAFLVRVSHYEVLGIPYQATTEEVEAAYEMQLAQLPRSTWRSLLLQVRTGRCAASLASARETLTRPSSRARYDAEVSSIYFWMPFH